MSSGLSKNIQDLSGARRRWHVFALVLLVSACGLFVSFKYEDTLLTEITEDLADVRGANLWKASQLDYQLKSLLGELSQHQLSVTDSGSNATDVGQVEGVDQPLIQRVEASERLIQKFYGFWALLERISGYEHFVIRELPQYANVHLDLVTELAALEGRILRLTGTTETALDSEDYRLITTQLAPYQNILNEIAITANRAQAKAMAGYDQTLLLSLRSLLIGLVFLLCGAIAWVFFWRDRARIKESAAEAYESMIGVMEFMDPSWAIDTSGTVIYWNHAVETLTGIAGDDIIGKNDHEYALPFYGERRKVLIDLVLEWDAAIQEKYVFIDTHEDGSISAASYHPNLNGGTYLASSAQLLKTSTGKVIGAIETVRDITQETQSKEELFKARGEGQQALRLAEERLTALESVRDVAADAMITFDATKLIRSANPAAESIFGYSPEQLVGQSLLTICSSECLDSMDPGERIELEGLHKDGTRFPISVSVSQIAEEGEWVLIANIRDLKVTREQENQISHLESLLSLKSFDFIDQGISVFDRNLKLLSANQAFLDLLQFPEEFRSPGTPFEDMLRFNAGRGEYGEGDIETQVQDRLALARKFEPHEFERTRNDGVIIHIVGTPIDEGIGGFITVYTDVTKLRGYDKQQQEEIKQLESVLHLEAMEHIGVGVTVYDDDLRLIRANRAHKELYDLPDALVEPGTPMTSVIRFLAEQGIYGEGKIEDQVNEALGALRSREEGRRDLYLPNGKVVEIHQKRLEGGVVLIHSDVTDSREALRKARSTDPVTGLMTLEAVTELVKELFPRLAESGGQSIAVRLQVDRFGVVNEIYGQVVGDQLLKQVAQRIRGVASDDALVGRAGGNEFVLIDEAKDAANMANAVVKVLREAMKPPFYFRSFDGSRQKISLTLSGGIVLFPQNGTELDDLINKSRLSLQYAASQGGDAFRFFDWKATRRRFASDRITVENDLRTALEQDQFFLDYQPQIELRSDGVHGCEALVRWQHPRQGLIPPMEFIPVAEETGLIVPIGEWVLRSACQQAKKWQVAGHPPFVISVNVSAVQFRNDGIVDSIREVLDETGLEAKYLELELTESIVADDLDGTRQILNDLKALGLSLAIDDFGTGYSSLAYLTELPFDTLKIDQAFIRGKEKHNWAIVRAVCQLARSLELSVVAEGVEVTDHVDRLAGLGCQIGQGYFFSPPLSQEEFGTYLDEHETRDTALSGSQQEAKLRVGLPTFAAINQFQKVVMDFRVSHPELQIEIQCDTSDHLVESLSLRELDVIVAPNMGQLDMDPQHAWLDQPVWLGSRDFTLDNEEPVPVLAHPEGSPFRKRMLDSLRQAHRQSHIVYQSPALRDLIDVLIAGMGITALPLSAVRDEEAMRSGQIRVLDPEKDGLPVLESVQYGIYSLELESDIARAGQSSFTDRLAELIDSFGCERL